MEPTLEKVFASQIKMEKYHRTYWPYPGFVAEGLVLRRNTAMDLPPVGSVERVRVEGSWVDLFLLRNRIATVYADGLHVVIPPVGSRANREDFPPGSGKDFEGPTTAVGRFVVKDALLEILRTDGGKYSFPIERLEITNLQKNSAIGYTLRMQVDGEIAASGKFGPLVGKELATTPASGEFTFSDVKLDGISDLHGVLTSKGSFRGTLAAMEAQAESQIVSFSVGQGQGVAVAATSSGAVNGLNGEIQFHALDVTTGKTTLHVTGAMTGAPKVTELDLTVARGRAEDLLRPMMQAEPPVVGPVRLHSHARVAAAAHAEDFLDRLTMTGVFEIPTEKLTDRPTEKSLTAFSERAQGGKEAVPDGRDVVSSLVGAVAIAKGTAHATRLVFEVPGASIEANGTFDLRNESVNMLGEMRMEADISHVTTGWKSFLLKPLIPFFKKKGAGAAVPIKVTGKPGSYKVGQNILH